MKFINIAAIAILLQTAKISSAVDVESPLINETTAAAASNATDETVATTTTAGGPADATADGFTPLDGDFSTVDSVTISIPHPCPSGKTTTYPYPMFTIQPSTVAYASSFPANLVTPVISGNELKFEWNDAVAKDATSGGVQIGLPSDQFNKLHLGDSLRAQILDGFTSVQRLEVNGGGSTLKATLTSNTNPDLALSVEGAAAANVISSMIGSVESMGVCNVKVQADSITSIQVGGASQLAVDGSVSGSGSVSGASRAKITGDMSGTLTIEGASKMYANTIMGSISNSMSSTVTAASCANVESIWSSICTVCSPPTVDVDVSQYDVISTITKSCNAEEGSFLTGDDESAGSPAWVMEPEPKLSCETSTSSLGSSTSFAIAAVAGATTSVAFLFM